MSDVLVPRYLNSPVDIMYLVQYTGYMRENHTTGTQALAHPNAEPLMNGRCVGHTEYDERHGTVLVMTWHDPKGCEHLKLEICDSCEGNGEDQAPFDYLDYLPQGGPCRFCGGRGSFPTGSYYDTRLARLVIPGDSSWRAELAS